MTQENEKRYRCIAPLCPKYFVRLEDAQTHYLECVHFNGNTEHKFEEVSA